MINIIKILFPFKLQLTILQLEEYKPIHFISWISKNFFKRHLEFKKSLVLTQKIKLIIFISTLYLLLSLIYIPLFVIFALNPFLLYLFSIFTLKPYEILNKKRVIHSSRIKINSNKNIKVIGITGSYGKTSTKEILYHLLKTKYKVLKTPASFNTVFGIAKVIDLELDSSYDYFICEMGAYVPGEINELCQITNPEYGIITGIDKQHYERFKSVANIIKTKFELYDYIKNSKKFVFNTENKYISEEINKRRIKYSPTTQISNPKLSKTGLVFVLKYKQKNYKIKTLLFGLHHLTNLKTAIEMSLKLGISITDTINALKSLKSPVKRFELKQIGKTIIVDNTYNSNPVSFSQTIESAKLVKGKKAFITPGLVELGKEELIIHASLAKQADKVFDKIILVGNNPRIISFKKALVGNNDIQIIPDTRSAYQDAINELIKQNYDWIFLENDLTQNY